MTESDGAIADADRPEGDVVLITDASAEGEAIASALRARGFTVLDVPLGLLASRIVGESPRVLIVDVDQPGAVDAVEHVRELTGGATAELMCIGDPMRAAELGASRESGRVFDRPADIDRIVEQVALVAEPARRDHAVRGTTPPPSYAPRRETSPPVSRPADMAAFSDLPPSGDPLDVASLLPSGDDPSASARLLPTQLSPELEQLLNDAEQRVVAHAHPSSIPMPDEEVDLILSPDVLAALDEPLEAEDDGGGTGSGTGTPLQNIASANRPGTAGVGTADIAGRFATHADTRAMDSRAEMLLDAQQTGFVRDRGLPSDSGLTPHADADIAALSGDPALGPIRNEPPATQARPSTNEPPGTNVGEWASRASHETRSPAAFGTYAPAPSAQGTPSRVLRSAASATPIPAVIEGVVRPTLELPTVLGRGDAVKALARAVAARASGSLALNSPTGLRRIVLRDGDIVTAGSGAADETLLAFLAGRGDVERDVVTRLSGKLPPFGRHAGAALIAHGHLGQDDLWPVLRAHAEWVIGRALLEDSGTCELEDEPPGRFKAEPSVFGGATGAEVVVETARRVVQPDVALHRLGGGGARIDAGTRAALLSECALRTEEEELVRNAPGRTLADLIATAEPEFASVVYALATLDVLTVLAPAAPVGDARHRAHDPLDDEAVRQRVRARMALVEDGDYFAVLGIARHATSYEIRRAYLDLRRNFEPARVLTAATADLADDVRAILEVLDEAYEILRDAHRRERYRRAIEAGPP